MTITDHSQCARRFNDGGKIAEKKIIKAARKAAITGNRRDLQEYLKLRRERE